MTVHAASGTRRRAKSRGRLRLWLRRLARIALIVAGAVFLSIAVFRFVNPPITSVMAASKLRGASIDQTWVPLKDISRHLPLAVIAAEDGRFCVHWGVDWGAVRDAIKEGDGFADFRGASTIPMQTAKNLYLWNRRSYVRKILEVPLAYAISIIWPKERIMEVYLNVAQFGPGIYGAEAASRRYFGKSALKLTRREAVLLAATLPQPRFRNPGKPSTRLNRIATTIERRLPYIAKRADCILPQR